MIGVVLWSDPRARKAVIWCEDHGDLAFYSDAKDPCLDGLSFVVGDLVEFDVETDRHLRYAYNPQLVKADVYRHLPDALQRSTPPVSAQADSDGLKTAEIIPFQTLVASADMARQTQPSSKTG